MRTIEAQYNIDPKILEEIMTTTIYMINTNADNQMITINDTTSTNPIVIPVTHFFNSYRTGTLHRHNRQQVIDALGFEPNVEDDPDKVENSWRFTVDGHECAVWDYKGSHKTVRPYWSVYDPANVLGTVFGDEHVEAMK